MKDNVSINDNLNEFNSFLAELMGVGMKIDEEEQDTLLLCSMSDSRDNLIMILSHVIQVIMDSIVTSLLSKELRRISMESSNPTSSF